MLVCPVESYGDTPGSDLVPLSSHLVKRTAKFLCISLHDSNALAVIAQHLHSRQAIFTSERIPLNDYAVILDAVNQHDPLTA